MIWFVLSSILNTLSLEFQDQQVTVNGNGSVLGLLGLGPAKALPDGLQ